MKHYHFLTFIRANFPKQSSWVSIACILTSQTTFKVIDLPIIVTEFLPVQSLEWEDSADETVILIRLQYWRMHSWFTSDEIVEEMSWHLFSATYVLELIHLMRNPSKDIYSYHIR